MKHISEMFIGDTLEEQIENMFNGFNHARMRQLEAEVGPDDWREADEQDAADDE